MDALVSERGTVAFILDGNSMGWIRADDGHRVTPCSPADFNCILRDSGPLEALDGTSLPDVVQRLRLARDCDDALHLALIVLDAELSMSVRAEAAGELDDLLRDQHVAAKLKATLYAKPLPPSADLAGALAACVPDSAGRTHAVLQQLLGLQGAIRDVRRAWDAVPTGVFGSEQDRSEFQSAAVRLGLFREFVEITAKRSDPALFLVESLLNPAIQALSNSRAALQRWANFLKQEARYPEVTTKIAAREEEVDRASEAASRVLQRGKEKEQEPHAAHGTFERVKRQKSAIVSAMRRGDRRIVTRLVEELVAFHLETDGAEFASKSLCDLAMEAKALDQPELQLRLVEKAVALKPDDTWARVQYADALRSNNRLGEAPAAYAVNESVRSREGVKDQLIALLAEIGTIPRNQLAESATVDKELAINSVALVELQLAIEDKFDIQIDPIRIIELNEFGAIIDYIHQCVLGAA